MHVNIHHALYIYYEAWGVEGAVKGRGFIKLICGKTVNANLMENILYSFIFIELLLFFLPHL